MWRTNLRETGAYTATPWMAVIEVAALMTTVRQFEAPRMASTLIAARENCDHKMQNIHVSSSFYLCYLAEYFERMNFWDKYACCSGRPVLYKRGI
jgi:hypothetical protein